MIAGWQAEARDIAVAQRPFGSDVRTGPNVIRLGAGAPGGAKYLSKRLGLRLSAELANRADIRSEIGAVTELSILSRR